MGRKRDAVQRHVQVSNFFLFVCASCRASVRSVCSYVCTQVGVLFVGVVLARSGRFVVMSVDVCVPVCSYSVLNFSGRRTCTHKQCVRLS